MNATQTLNFLLDRLQECEGYTNPDFRDRFFRELGTKFPQNMRVGREQQPTVLIEHYWQQPDGPGKFQELIAESGYFGFPATDQRVRGLQQFIGSVVDRTILLHDLDRLLSGPGAVATPMQVSTIFLRTMGSAALPKPPPVTLRDFSRAVLDDRRGTVRTLFEFLLRVAARMRQTPANGWARDAERLTAWCEENEAEIPDGATVAELTAEIIKEPAVERRILVRVDSDGYDDEAECVLDVWEYWDVPGGGYPGKECVWAERKVAGVGIKFRDGASIGRAVDVATRLSSGTTPDSVVVEVMLPPDQLDHEVEQWGSAKAGVSLGQLVPVVVRRLASDVDPAERRSWQLRWSSFLGPAADDGRPQVYVVSHPGDAGFVDGQFFCVAFHCELTAEQQGELLERAWAASIPAAMWSRGPEDDIGRVHQWERPQDYPRRVYERRRTEPAVLVWDNPFWIPDGKALAWESVL